MTSTSSITLDPAELQSMKRLTTQLKHEAAWCSTFSCLETSQTRDSAGFQASLSQNQICLQMILNDWGEMVQWLGCEFTHRKVRGSKPTSASRLPLSRLGKPDSIPALVILLVGWPLGTERVLQLDDDDDDDDDDDVELNDSDAKWASCN
ncbi:hypothetical protein CSKR_105243 [Clonorchis sinensis]|uniref:Uncharacterized protein n=1 Tax=Clonorchis sinensis TaxID=79923 RepID=A0A419PMG5_CLOSI|nr:hypothetical protein CSKR_105243 [Clonorchis sinensis]